MATLFDSASLVMIPSGVKEDKLYSIKPTDGSGDFTFSRGSDIQATRVNSSGLIEKAKVNRALYSQDFDNATWRKESVDGVDPIVTPNYAAAPDGTQTATRLQLSRNDANGSYSQIYQFPISLSVGSVYTWSVYLKSLSGTPTISIVGDFGRPPVTLTNEWVRYSGFGVATNANTQAEIAILGPNYSAGNSLTADFLAWGYQFQEGTAPSEYTKTEGSIVIDGLTADLPRLDYSGGASCPSLLLEPSRTNLVPNSEYFGDSSWTTTAATTEVGFLSPEGNLNAYKIAEDNTNSIHRIFQTSAITASPNATISVYAKYNGRRFVLMRIADSGVGRWYDLIDGVKGDAFTSAPNDSTIEPVGNDWYRITISHSVSSVARFELWVSDTESISAYQGDVTKGVYLYGAQMEVGSYPTSYIPTYGTAANRGEDLAAVGSSDLISTQAFTMFFEHKALGISGTSWAYRLDMTDGSDEIEFYVNSGASMNIYLGGNGGYIFGSSSNDGYIAGSTSKVALSYDGNRLAYFINGSLYDSTTSVSFNDVDTTLVLQGSRNITNKQSLLFPTALTDAECIALTTI